WIAFSVTTGAGAALRFAVMTVVGLGGARVLSSDERSVLLTSVGLLALAIAAMAGMGDAWQGPWPYVAAALVAAGAGWLPVRAPVLAVAVFALGLVLARAAGPEVLDRFAAVGLVAGLAAGIGLLPYLHPFDPDDAVTGSPIAWMAFIGPALAVVVAGTRGLVP